MLASLTLLIPYARWRDPNFPLPDEEAFEAIKAGVDSMPTGVRMMLNSGKFDRGKITSDTHTPSGEFYGPNLSPANLELLSRFYQKYPDYVDKTFLSVKVCHILSS